MGRRLGGKRGFVAALAAAGLGLACPRAAGDDGAEPPVLRLLSFQQAGRDGVCLNESLVFLFSAPLDPASLTPASFRIEDPGGHPARGELSLRDASLVFVPELPRKPDLTDGGLLPWRGYSVRLLGFPAPNGLRGLDGAPLEGCLELAFRTAGTGPDQTPFLHTFPRTPGYLYCERPTIEPLEPIELLCDEPLDPRSLGPDLFELAPADADGDVRLGVRVRLAENRADGARLELQALRTPGQDNAIVALPRGEVFLVAAPRAARPLTLGGRPVETAWEIAGSTFQRLNVRRAEARQSFAFDRSQEGSPIELAGYDGTAHWGADGVVRMRLPAAVGDGAEGVVDDLGLRVDERAKQADARGFDLSAQSLSVGANEVVDLSDFEGLVVLRAQSRLEVAGTLRRRGFAEGSPTLRARLEPLRRSQNGDPRARTLSAFLEAARAEELPWTVLIAGGELRVPGRIEVDGPLLLVAGGWVRIAGLVEALEVYATPEGGGNYSLHTPVEPLELLLDEPTTNPLRAPLRVGVLSDLLRPTGGVDHWIDVRPHGRAGAGGLEVFALGERERGPRGSESLGPVELSDLGELNDCPGLRLQIELSMPAGPGPWDPPVLDALEVVWSPLGAEARGR